jgi:hypothetical protein
MAERVGQCSSEAEAGQVRLSAIWRRETSLCAAAMRTGTVLSDGGRDEVEGKPDLRSFGDPWRTCDVRC